MKTNHFFVFFFICFNFISCVSDSEIRALYTNRPCHQQIVMNTEVKCVQSEPCCVTPDNKEIITFDNDILEKNIVFDKTICPYSRSLANLKWEPAVYFDYDKHDLTQTAKKRLENNIRFLLKYQDSRIAVRGFTDNRGNHAYNQRLASRRALTTLNYLKNKGIHKTRIVISPVGETAPLLPNKTVENMAINRRVEMLLLDKSGQPVPYVLLTKEMMALLDQEIDKITFCKIWKNRVVWYPGIFFHGNNNYLSSQKELKKLELNIHVLKTHPEFMISMREFSSNNAHNRHSLERIQYVESIMSQSSIDRNRIQVVPPEDTLIFHRHASVVNKLPCVEMLLLDNRARPFSVIVKVN